MDKKTQFKFRFLLGVLIIGGVFFLSFRYLMKGPPFLKVLAIGLVIGTCYFVVQDLINKNKNKNNKEEL